MVVAKKKAQRLCSVCREEGHNARSCPERDAAPVEEEEYEEEEEGEEEEEEEEEQEEDAAPDEPVASKKQLSSMKKADDAFTSFVSKAAKTWEGTVAVADVLTKDIPRISWGNIGLDIATYGGVPRGRIIRVYGREKSAKSGSCWNLVATWQHQHCGICYEREECEHGTVSGIDRPKAKALWIDAENRIKDMWYWPEGHGVDLSCLLVQAPPSGQHIVDFVDASIRAHGAGIGLIVIDSVANLTSMEEIKKATMKGRTAPVNALLLNKALRKWTSAQSELGVDADQVPTIVLINQIRHTMDAFGSPEVMPGGKGQDFATSIDIRFARKKEH
jgi:RecA/RadA recombinase